MFLTEKRKQSVGALFVTVFFGKGGRPQISMRTVADS
jgi:hypothetical protein